MTHESKNMMRNSKSDEAFHSTRAVNIKIWPNTFRRCVPDMLKARTYRVLERPVRLEVSLGSRGGVRTDGLVALLQIQQEKYEYSAYGNHD